MRFITEFEFNPINESHRAISISRQKMCEYYEIGRSIGKLLGWKETGQMSALGTAKEVYTLEIEAFPMDKWIEFKQRILNVLDSGSYELTSITESIRELESYGKPELLTESEYRGQGSHCKACEDEAAGIKHIMAQKHTCKK